MLAAAALVWITLDASVSTPPLDIGRAWTLAGTADASFQPLFVYPDYRSGLATHGGFRLARRLAAGTTLTFSGRAGATYVDGWRPVFEASTELSWRERIEVRAGLRHDDRLRREGSLADFRDPTGRMFAGATVLPFKRRRLAAGAAVDYERALPGTGRLPPGLSGTIIGRLQWR
jgi:hypothetical protein